MAKDTLLAKHNGVMNAAMVRGNAVGETLFYGAGAGRMPTASAMVSDILDTFRAGTAGIHRLAARSVRSGWWIRTSRDAVVSAQRGGLGDHGAETRAALAEKLAGRTPLSLFRVLD